MKPEMEALITTLEQMVEAKVDKSEDPSQRGKSPVALLIPFAEFMWEEEVNTGVGLKYIFGGPDKNFKAEPLKEEASGFEVILNRAEFLQATPEQRLHLLQVRMVEVAARVHRLIFPPNRW